MPTNAFEKARFLALWLLAAVLPLSIALTNVVFFALVIFWLVLGPSTWRQWPLRWGKYEKLFAVFIGVSLISMIAGRDASRSLFRITNKDMNGVVLFFVLAWVRQASEAKKLILVFVGSTIISASLGWVQWFSHIYTMELHDHISRNVPVFFQGWPDGLLDYLGQVNGRAMGTRSHPLRYSEGLLLGVGWLMAFFIFEERKKAAWSLVGVALVAGALAASQSRGSWLAAVVMLAVAVAYRGRRIVSLRTLMLLLPFVLVMGSPYFRQRAKTITDLQFNSNRERLHMWRVAWTLWKQNPVWGIGPGNVRIVTAPFLTPDEASDGGWGHLHNTFIQMAVERGLVGFLAFCGFMGSLLIPMVRGSFRAGERQEWIIGGVLAGLAFLLTGLTEYAYGNMDVLMSFYFVTALTLVLVETTYA